LIDSIAKAVVVAASCAICSSSSVGEAIIDEKRGRKVLCRCQILPGRKMIRPARLKLKKLRE
jgi:hypothetical protein